MTSFSISACATDRARAEDNDQFDGKADVLISMLSVWPSTEMRPSISLTRSRTLSSTSMNSGCRSADPEPNEPFSLILMVMERKPDSISSWPPRISLSRLSSRFSTSRRVSMTSSWIWAILSSSVSSSAGLGSRAWSGLIWTVSSIPEGSFRAILSCCTPKAFFMEPAMSLYFWASISENDSSSTKKHINRDIRSAKVAIHLGDPPASSMALLLHSGYQAAAALPTALASSAFLLSSSRCLGFR